MSFSPRKLLSSLTMMLSGSFTSLGLSVIITISLAKMLSPSLLGLLMTAEAFVDLFKFFFYFGFNNSIMRMASTHPEGFDQGLNKALGNALLIKTIINIPLLGVIFLVSRFFFSDELLQNIVLLYGLVYFFESYSSLFGIARRALGQFKLMSGILVLNKVLRLGTILIILRFTQDLKILVLAFLAEKIIRLLISFFTTIKFVQPKLDLTSIKAMFKQCLGYAFSDPLQGIQNKVDRLMLEKLIHPAAVAFYSIPAKLTMAVNALIKTGSSVFNPHLHQSRTQDPNNYKNTITSLYRYSNLAALMVFFGIYYLSQPSLSLIFGDKYLQAISIAPLFAYISFINIIENTPELIMVSEARHKTRASYKVLSIVINIALNFYFIAKLGVVGVIYATIIANGIRLILKLFIARKFLPRPGFLIFCGLVVCLTPFLPFYIIVPASLAYIILSKSFSLEDIKKFKSLIKKN